MTTQKEIKKVRAGFSRHCGNAYITHEMEPIPYRKPTKKESIDESIDIVFDSVGTFLVWAVGHVLIAVIIIAGILAISSLEWKLP